LATRFVANSNYLTLNILMPRLNFKNWTINETPSEDAYRFKRPFGLSHGVIPEPVQNIAKMVAPQLANKYLPKFKDAFGSINAARGLPHPDELEKVNQTQQGYHNQNLNYDQQGNALHQQSQSLDRETKLKNKQNDINNGHPDDPQVRESKYNRLMQNLLQELRKSLIGSNSATVSYALDSMKSIAAAMTKGGEVEPVHVEGALKAVNQDKGIDSDIKMHYWKSPRTVFETIIFPAFNADNSTWYNSKAQGKERFPPETVYSKDKMAASEERWAKSPYKLSIEKSLIELIKAKFPLADKGEYNTQTLKKMMHDVIDAMHKNGNSITVDKKDYNTILSWASDRKKKGSTVPGAAPSSSPSNPSTSSPTKPSEFHLGAALIQDPEVESGKLNFNQILQKAEELLLKHTGMRSKDFPPDEQAKLFNVVNKIANSFSGEV